MYAVLFILAGLAAGFGAYYITDWLNPQNLGEILVSLVLVIIYVSGLSVFFNVIVEILVK